MTTVMDLNKYWGTQVIGLRLDCKNVSLILDLFWTVNSVRHNASIILADVSKLEYDAQDIYVSEVVELVSIAAERNSNGLRIIGEMSNCEFTVLCKSVKVE